MPHRAATSWRWIAVPGLIALAMLLAPIVAELDAALAALLQALAP